MQNLGCLAQGQGHRGQRSVKGHLGAFVTYCNISCFLRFRDGVPRVWK